MRALLDVNVLLALLDSDHALTRDVTERFEALDGGWATCPITQNGFVRISSQPGYTNPMPVSAAVALLQAATADTDHEFWPCDIAITDPSRIDPNRILRPAQLTDAYLLALAVSRGGRFVTLDRRITTAAAPGAASDQLVVIGR
ncbi:MAG: PIN domain-containing protein [Bifidobacteriaceae bacterium]|nr:PIN domain-containing protein [Bifidobacteriaceae bacterium]